MQSKSCEHAALIASVPVAIAYNLFLDRFISGITGGAVK
jgi:multiple sugar transport system permease protein